MFDDKGGLHWASIFTMFAMALASAWLVFFEGWLPKNAFAAVIGGCAVILLIVMALFLMFMDDEGRRVFITEYWETARSDFKHICRKLFGYR